MLSSLIPIIFAIIFFIVMCVYIFLFNSLKSKYNNLKNRIHQISDDAPVIKTGQAYAMQLGDELKDFIKEKDGKIYLKVVEE